MFDYERLIVMKEKKKEFEFCEECKDDISIEELLYGEVQKKAIRKVM